MIKNKGVIKIISIKQIIINKMFKNDKKTYVISLLILVFLIIFFLGVNIKFLDKGGITINGILMPNFLKKEEIGVYIDGQVNKPRLYKIKKGSDIK